jgi:nucleotide-binding universal stress UspA family protein
MSALRSILLHLDASPRSVRRLTLARELAARHDAQVTAWYGTNSAAFSVSFAMDPGAGAAMNMLQELDSSRRAEARARFDRVASTAPTPIEWRELGDEPLIPGLAGVALYADLLIFGQHDPSDSASGDIPPDLVPSVLAASGRPALVIPYADTVSTLGQDALIAWKPTRESAHAVSAAMPLLKDARRIHLTVSDEDGVPLGAGDALEEFLRRHGVAAPIRRHVAVPSDNAGDGLLSLAADVGADLLVMGCYGHGRARELVLGGASRTVLKSMTVPVLMAH